MFTACGIMHRRCCRPVIGRRRRGCIVPQAVTHSIVFLEDGQNNCPKHVEQTRIINKALFLHLVGCLCYCIIYKALHERKISLYWIQKFIALKYTLK